LKAETFAASWPKGLKMAYKQKIGLAIVAFSVYIIGGIGCFSGILLILAMKGRDLWGYGDGRTIGYLFLCVGVSLSILGVLLMRIFRNRGCR
jgi:uncharacterized membrane protein YgdD (TMEM256/DUF423 family)